MFICCFVVFTRMYVYYCLACIRLPHKPHLWLCSLYEYRTNANEAGVLQTDVTNTASAQRLLIQLERLLEFLT